MPPTVSIVAWPDDERFWFPNLAGEMDDACSYEEADPRMAQDRRKIERACRLADDPVHCRSTGRRVQKSDSNEPDLAQLNARFSRGLTY